MRNDHRYCIALRKLTLLLIVVALVVALGASAALADRQGQPYKPRAQRGLVTGYVTPEQAIQCLVGPNVVVSNVTFNGAAVALGQFSGGTGIIGFDSGLVLSSGDVASVVGPNLQDAVSTDNGLPGDPDLDALIPGYLTLDAAVLEFDFECEGVAEFSFQYVFGSDEYNEWVNSDYNDVFGFFLNGTNVSDNIAVVPAGCSSPGIPVAINNVNCGDPYAPPVGVNCDCYRNNDLSDGGGGIDTEMDGLTQVFFATGAINPGVNHLKIAIADAGDHVFDSNVFIRCQSLLCQAPGEVGACCIGEQCFQLEFQDCENNGGSFYGIGTSCVPNPCPPIPANLKSWGALKNTYK